MGTRTACSGLSASPIHLPYPPAGHRTSAPQTFLLFLKDFKIGDLGTPHSFDSTLTLDTAVLFSLVCEHSLTPCCLKVLLYSLLYWQRNQVFLYQKWQKVNPFVSLPIVNRRVSSERNLFKLERAQHDKEMIYCVIPYKISRPSLKKKNCWERRKKLFCECVHFLWI